MHSDGSPLQRVGGVPTPTAPHDQRLVTRLEAALEQRVLNQSEATFAVATLLLLLAYDMDGWVVMKTGNNAPRTGFEPKPIVTRGLPGHFTMLAT